MFADVIVDISVDALDRTFQYIIPNELEKKVQVGSRVGIPFGKGNRRLTGFVVQISDKAKWPVEKMKSLFSVDEKDIPVEDELISLALFIREKYGATLNEALKVVLPVKRKIKSVSDSVIISCVSNAQLQRELNSCTVKGYKAKKRFIEALLNNEGTVKKSVLTKEYKVTKDVISGYEKKGFVKVETNRLYRNPTDNIVSDQGETIVLNEEQQKIVDDFSKEYENNIRRTYLLYGVTGSGKTEVYIEMIDRVLKDNKQVIMLIPEIALTYQTVERFRKRFGERISILNSRMSDGERFDQYELAKEGKVDIVIGPRSALFTPFSNIGLIIMDEEHENSYKSEMPPKYHARTVAIERAKRVGASVLLGSATPSVESYHYAKNGIYKLYTLKNRVGNATLPTVHIVDMKKELKEKNISIFSRLLKEKIDDRIKKNEQVVLFLNKRGYAGFISCRNCGYVLKCSHCDVSMKAHKNYNGKVEKVLCHYCGAKGVIPKKCPECGSGYIGYFGLGTQKVEELVKKEFPTARVLRMDSDTTQGKDGHEKILGPFRRKEADILVGTQMIVKGHDIPDVTLVAAIAADLSMYNNDYRASERTFQLLMQASGRAGRKDKKGEVVIQTYNPEESVLHAVENQNADEFYNKEVLYRRLTGYPPFSNIMAVLVTSINETNASACANALAVSFKKADDKAVIIGPSVAGISKIKDRYRYCLYIKCEDEDRLCKIKNEMELISHLPQWERTCSVQFDLNPIMTI